MFKSPKPVETDLVCLADLYLVNKIFNVCVVYKACEIKILEVFLNNPKVFELKSSLSIQLSLPLGDCR